MRFMTLALIFGLFISGTGMASSREGTLRDGYAAYDNDDYDLAAKHLLPFEKEGPARAQFLLAMMYLNGLSVPQDAAKGKSLLEAAVRGGDLDAAYVLGSEQLYENKFFPQNTHEALRYLGIAAKAGHGEAMHELGWVYYDSTLAGAKDHGRAFDYFSKSALLYPESAYALALMYSKGHGVNQDNLEAYAWAIVGELAGDSRASDVLKKVEPLLPAEQQRKARTLGDQRFRRLLTYLKEQRTRPGHGLHD